MRLTRRGRGFVAGIIIAAVAGLGATFHGGGEPVLGDPGMPSTGVEEPREGWQWEDDLETVGGEFNEQPATNPCPYALHIEGVCEGGF
jgi:hypothetical protein